MVVMVVGRMMARLWRHGGGVCEQGEGCSLGGLLGEGIINDQSVVPTFVARHVVGALGDLVGLTLPNPLDLFQTDSCQLLNHGGRRVEAQACRTAREAAFIHDRATGDRGRQGGVVPGMLEDAEIERFLMGLETPGDSMFIFDVDPSDEVRLARGG